MRRFVALLWVMVSLAPGCTASPGDGSVTPSTSSEPDDIPAEQVPGWVVEPFPGGGSIVYGIARDGYIATGVGVLTAADGIVELRDAIRRPGRGIAFGYWDPGSGSHGLLVVRADGDSDIRAYRLAGDRATETGRWRPDYALFAAFSHDGRWIAEAPFDREGRLQTGGVVLTDRTSGDTDVLRLGRDLVVGAWSPDGRLVASPWGGGRSVFVDPRTGHVDPLEWPGARIAWGDAVTWSPDGGAFAVELEGPQDAMGLFAADGRLLRRVPVGTDGVSLPTWSPDGTQIAYIVRGREPAGHRHARLLVHEVTTGRTRVVRRGVSDAFWASWSPDGRWLLIDDWTRERWLFVPVFTGRAVPYRRLGDMPRWCCPSSPGIEVRNPVS